MWYDNWFFPKFCFIHYWSRYQQGNYLSLAANHNYQKALFDLGCIYYTGQSVKKDINKAIHYFQLSAFQENDYAQFNLGLINLKGIEVQKDIEQFLIWISQLKTTIKKHNLC